MTSQKPENRYKTAFRTRLKKRFGKDIWILPKHEMARHGTPDLLICLYGYFVAIEIKTDQDFAKKSPRDALQVHELGLITTAGGLGLKMSPKHEALVFGFLGLLEGFPPLHGLQDLPPLGSLYINL